MTLKGSTYGNIGMGKIWGLGVRDATPIVANQMEKTSHNEMEAGSTTGL